SVTIAGVNLGEATSVGFGANAASSFTVSSPSTIVAVAPPGAGTVDVRVSTASSTSSPVPGERFAYIPPPTVSRVKPNKGPAAGGTSSTISGTGFSGVTGVSFGAIPAASFAVSSPSTIVAVAPPATAGAVDITVK